MAFESSLYKTPSFRKKNPLAEGFQDSATASFGSNGDPKVTPAAPAVANPNATPPNPFGAKFNNPFDISQTSLFKASQDTALRQLDSGAPVEGFEEQANIARDAQKVAQMNAQKAKRDQLIGQGLKDSGTYINEGILGPADQDMRDRAELERGLAAARGDLIQKRIAQGQAVAGNLTGQLQSQNAQNIQLLGMGAQAEEADKNRTFQQNQLILSQGFQASEADKTRVFQSQMQALDRALQEKGQNLSALLAQLDNLPDEQVKDILGNIAASAGMTYPVFDEKGQPVIDPKTGKQQILPGLQNYASIYAAKALPVLNSYRPGSTLSPQESQVLSASWDAVKNSGNTNIAQGFNDILRAPEWSKDAWVKANDGKLVKAPDGNIYEVQSLERYEASGSMSNLTPTLRAAFNAVAPMVGKQIDRGAAGGIILRNVSTGALVRVGDTGTIGSPGDKN